MRYGIVYRTSPGIDVHCLLDKFCQLVAARDVFSSENPRHVADDLYLDLSY